MVTDWQLDKWRQKIYTLPPTVPNTYVFNPGISKEDFEAFRKEFLEFKDLVKRALKYDVDNNQPDCEVDDKVNAVRKIAEQLGIDMEDVFPSK